MYIQGENMLTEVPIATITEHFTVVEDRRVEYLLNYSLEEILIIQKFKENRSRHFVKFL